MKIGFIGAGTIADAHIKGLQEIPEMGKITAICDVNFEAAKEKAEIAGGVPAYADYKAMLAKEELDIALVCLPHFLHLPVGLDVLNSGVHLFMEKPLANTVDECRKILAAAEANDRTIYVGHTHQYMPPLLKMKELIDSGAIGQPKMLFDEVTAYYNWEKRKGWFLDPGKAGGGALFNTSPHQADHFLYLIDSPVIKVRATMQALRPGQTIISDGMAYIEYENGVQGVLGIFQSTRIENGSLRVRVLGTEGAIQCNPFENKVSIAKMDTVEEIECDTLNPYTNEWTECINAIKEKRPAITGGAYGMNVVALLEAMIRSSENGAEVSPETC